MSEHILIPEYVKAARPWAKVIDVGPPVDSRGDIGTANMQVCERNPNSPDDGYRRWYAHFKPTAEELAALNEGGTIEMCQLGNAPQPFSVQCWGSGSQAPSLHSVILPGAVEVSS